VPNSLQEKAPFILKSDSFRLSPFLISFFF
jgi:hypothetical protein